MSDRPEVCSKCGGGAVYLLLERLGPDPNVFVSSLWLHRLHLAG